MNSKKFKNRAGFTLIELIVVIAIMAILAGVAVPVYSGYIEKAEKAGDLQLLAAVNSAFGAACVENDVAPTDLADGSVTFNVESKTVTEKYNPSFQKYFAGNETATFKVIKAVTFKGGVFVDAELSSAMQNILSSLLANNSSDIATMNNGNTFMTADGLGVNGLLDKVDFVTDVAGIMDNSAMNQVFASDDFRNMAAKILGLDPSDPDLPNKMNTEMGKLVQEMVANGTAADPTEAQKKIQANAAVLLAAENASKQNSTDIMNMLTGSDVKGSILNTLKTDEGSALSQAAVAYGMYTAYAYSTGDADLIANTNDPMKIMNGLQDEGFQAYLKDDSGNVTAQAQKDLDAYMAAMNMISDSAGNLDAASEIMVNGFNDPALAALLQQAMTSSK